MDRAERITNAVHEIVNMSFDNYCLVRQAIILELGEIKKEESKETAISSNSNQIIQDDCSTNSPTKQELRNEAEILMIKIGFKPSTNGFKYIADTMELFFDDSWRKRPMEHIYYEIASRHDVSHNSVYRAISNAFEKVLDRSNLVIVEKYLSFEQTTVKELIHTLWRSLQQEIGENNGE